MKRTLLPILVLVLLAACIAQPVSAVLLEVTVKGTVSGMDAEKNSLTIANPAQYGCVYAASGSPVCSYTPMSNATLTGTVPDTSAYAVFRNGDPLVGTSIGGAGGTWIALSKLFGSGPDQTYVTEIVGDASSVSAPLAGNYTLDLQTVPDCSSCSGTTCTATSSAVAIRSDGMVVAAKTLKPGEFLQFNGRNDGSSIAVTFIKGQALSDSCPQAPKGLVGGVQPISDYRVHVEPPIGMTVSKVQAQNAANATGTPPAAPATPQATAFPATPAPTQKSPVMPAVILGAIGIAAALAAIRRQ